MKTLCLITLTIFVSTVVNAQNEEALHIPLEADNQFPPDHLESEGIIEGSGDGVLDEPKLESTTELHPPIIESIDSDSDKAIAPTSNLDNNTSGLPCPQPCVCNVEGDTNDYVVDCSGYDLTEFPTPIDPSTTTLKLHNNKLTEIPKEISDLKNLKVLNADNNSIMELASGSISELPQLVTLKLANNRLIEYPKDLKNSISLTKLEELDLGGNDIRTILTSENFSNFKSLRKITLPSASSELLLDLCSSLKDSLETVCSENCNSKSFDCPDAPESIDEDLLSVLPGAIAFSNAILDHDTDPVVETENKNEETVNTEDPLTSNAIETTPASNSNISSVSDFSLRTAVNNQPEEISASNTVVETHSDTHEEVKIGAKTAPTKGGVDKSVIGIIIAGMVVVVAGITIKKNWSSITKRFSSSPRPNERTGGQANGSTPEEVPLQDKEKSPV